MSAALPDTSSLDALTKDQSAKASPTKMFVVAKTRPGYAREDADEVDVMGLFTCEETASRVALVAHAQYFPVSVDQISPGLAQSAQELGVSLAPTPNTVARAPRSR